MRPEWIYGDEKTTDTHNIALGDLLAFGLQAPEKVAILDHKQHYSFEALNTITLKLADVLKQEYGVRPGQTVMILTEKHCLVPALAIAIWRVGGIYAPLDGESPAERILSVAEQVQPTVLIDFNEQRTSLDESATNRISFQTLFAQTNATSSNAPLESHHYQENDVVYILHTSGSTGQPKCVQITERNIKAYFRAHNQVLRFNDASKVFSLTPFHFDVSIEDTLLPLSVGATVYQYNRLHQGRIIRKTLIEQNVTHLIAVSTLLTMISDDESQINPDNFPHLSMVMTGAEVCAPNVINLWKERLPSTRVINAYGPTEVTIVATCYTIESAERNRDIAYPIGQPLDGVRVRLLDEYGQDVEPGSSGELCLGGDQVMLGYLNKPDETAERIFVQDDVRYYRTGDICFVDHNGDLQFVGRNDNEVKIKGRRIHLGEIQQQCMAVPGVERAAVGVHQRQGQPMISAVITTQERDKIEQVQAHLRSLLPSYMMPVIWGTTENVTLAASGKSNDKQLLRQLSEVFEQTSASIISLTE